jgi:hypothetical protein
MLSDISSLTQSRKHSPVTYAAKRSLESQRLPLPLDALHRSRGRSGVQADFDLYLAQIYVLATDLPYPSNRDTLTRHIPIRDSRDSHRNENKRSGVSRVSRACVNCAKARLRCNGEQPCTRCSNREDECVYCPTTRKRIVLYFQKPVRLVPEALRTQSQFHHSHFLPRYPSFPRI